jgi:hypothetical protein
LSHDKDREAPAVRHAAKEPGAVLQDLVRCEACNDFLWFSEEGYLTCKCKDLPYKEVSPDMVLDKILEEVMRNLEHPEFIGPLTAATNASVKEDGFKFAEPEVLKIVSRTLENAMAAGGTDNLRRALRMFVDEVRIHPDGKLEIYMVPVGKL